MMMCTVTIKHTMVCGSWMTCADMMMRTLVCSSECAVTVMIKCTGMMRCTAVCIVWDSIYFTTKIFSGIQKALFRISMCHFSNVIPIP